MTDALLAVEQSYRVLRLTVRDGGSGPGITPWRDSPVICSLRGSDVVFFTPRFT